MNSFYNAIQLVVDAKYYIIVIVKFFSNINITEYKAQKQILKNYCFQNKQNIHPVNSFIMVLFVTKYLIDQII